MDFLNSDEKLIGAAVFLAYILLVLVRYFIALIRKKPIKQDSKVDFNNLVYRLKQEAEISSKIFAKNIINRLKFGASYDDMAVILITVGQKRAEQILQFLDEDTKKVVQNAIVKNPKIIHLKAQNILNDFLHNFNQNDEVIIEYAQEDGEDNTKINNIDINNKADINKLYKILKDENSQIAALILSSLNKTFSTKVLDMFDEVSRAKIIHKMKRTKNVSPQVLKTIGNELNFKIIGV